MTVALDGHATGIFSTASSGTVTLTTTSTNDVIVVIVSNESTAGQGLKTVSSITAPGLTFTRRGGQTVTYGTLPCNVEIWWAPSTGILTAEVITVTLTGTIDDAALIAFGVSGAFNISSPWDSAPNPNFTTNSVVNGSAPTVTYTAYGTSSFVFSFGFSASNQGGSASGWTAIASAHNGGAVNFAFLDGFYNILSVPAGFGANSPYVQNSSAIFLSDVITGSGPASGPNYNASSKFLGYGILSVPATASSKFLGYTVIDAPVNAISASKVLGYAVLRTLPPPKPHRLPFHLLPDEEDLLPKELRKLISVTPSAIVFTRQPHEFSPLDDDDIPPLRQRNLAAPIPIVSPARVMKPPVDDEDIPPQRRRLLSVIKAIKRKLQTFTIT